MTIESEITAWNGKSAAHLSAIQARYVGEPDYASTLVSLLGRPALPGATWLIKALLETGAQMSVGIIDTNYSRLVDMRQWDQRLQILQNVAYLPVFDSQNKKIEAFLQQCLAQENKIVRAWAYSGYYYFAKKHPEYRATPRQLFDQDLQDEAPPVETRIHKLAGLGF